MNEGLDLRALASIDESEYPSDVTCAAYKRDVDRGFSLFCKRHNIKEDDWSFRALNNAQAREGEAIREEKEDEEHFIRTNDPTDSRQD